MKLNKEKYLKKLFIYLSYRAIGMAILMGIGMAFGLHLVKY